MNDPLPSGVRVSRRIVLHGGLAATALGALSRLGDPSRPRRDDVAAFLQRWTDRSAELVAAERPNEDAHLLALCAGLAELEPAAFPKRMRTTWDEGGMKSGPAHVAMPFLIVRFDLEPGVVIPAHNHVGYAFVSMGVAGEATVRHFEPEGAAPPPDDLRTGFRIHAVAHARQHPLLPRRRERRDVPRLRHQVPGSGRRSEDHVVAAVRRRAGRCSAAGAHREVARQHLREVAGHPGWPPSAPTA